MNGFLKTIQWSLLTNRRQYINNALGLTIGLFLIMAIQTGMLWGYSGGMIPFGESSTPAYFAVMIVASAFFAAQVCSDLKGKQLRSQYLMLPTSRRNKYWARVVIAFIQGFVIFVVALIAADVLQMLISLIFTGDAYSATKAFFSDVCGNPFKDSYYNSEEGYPVLTTLIQYVALVAIAAWGFSSYILGGFLFRKMPLLMTTIGWIVFWIVIMAAGTWIAYKFFSSLTDEATVEFWWDADLTINIAVTMTGLLFTVFNLWLSYRKFCRMTISPGKWFN